MKSYIVRVYRTVGVDGPRAGGIVEDPDTGQMHRFRNEQELWAIVSGTQSASRIVWYGGNSNDNPP
jgi:hypothetical protein